MTVAIRRAQPADAAAIALGIRETLPEPWTEAQVRAELGLAASRAWVAEETSWPRLLGVLLARRAADELEILQLAVAAGARRRGVGRALVETALAEAPRARAVYLEVRGSNRGARDFYRSLGFVEQGTRERYYRDGAAAIRLGRSL